MVTLEEVKVYLRIDTDAEDTLLNNLIKAGESYLQGAIDGYTELYNNKPAEWKAKADQAELLLIADWYENRTNKTRPVASAVSLLIAQLQLAG